MLHHFCFLLSASLAAPLSPPGPIHAPVASNHFSPPQHEARKQKATARTPLRHTRQGWVPVAARKRSWYLQISNILWSRHGNLAQEALILSGRSWLSRPPSRTGYYVLVFGCECEREDKVPFSGSFSVPLKSEAASNDAVCCISAPEPFCRVLPWI